MTRRRVSMRLAAVRVRRKRWHIKDITKPAREEPASAQGLSSQSPDGQRTVTGQGYLMSRSQFLSYYQFGKKKKTRREYASHSLDEKYFYFVVTMVTRFIFPH